LIFILNREAVGYDNETGYVFENGCSSTKSEIYPTISCNESASCSYNLCK